MSKSLGTALYIELRRGVETSQVIISPQIYNPVLDKTQKSTVITRQISAENPKRSWRYYELKKTPIIEKSEDIERTVANISPLLQEISPFLVGYVSGGWKLFEKPIAVEMSVQDFDDLSHNKTPAAMLRRLIRARSEAGYPEEFFEVAKEEPAGYTPTTTTSF